MAATPSQRNWKGIAIALLVIGAVIGLVALAVVIMTPPDTGPRVRGARLTLADVVDPDRFSPRKLNGTWVSDTEFLFTDALGGVAIRDMAAGTTRHIMSNSTFVSGHTHTCYQKIINGLKCTSVGMYGKSSYESIRGVGRTIFISHLTLSLLFNSKGQKSL